MHIALVRRQFSRHRSGAERMVVNLLMWLVTQGHRVTAVGEGMDDDLRQLVEFIPVDGRSYSGWSRTESFAAAARDCLKTLYLDWVHGMARVPGIDGYHVLDPLQSYWLEVGYPARWISLLQSANPRQRSIVGLERSLIQSETTKAILVQSQFDRSLLTRLYAVSPSDPRVHVVPNGFDATLFRSIQTGNSTEKNRIRADFGIPADVPIVLFAGNDFRRKGLAQLIKAVARCEQTELQLVVAGTGSLGKYRAIANRLRLGDRVRFLGQVARMNELYHAADLFALPTWYDPFASVVLESLASGVPVLTTMRGGAADVVRTGENGFVVDSPENLGAISDSMNRFFNLSLQERTEMSRNALESVREFTAENYASKTFKVIQETLRARAA